MNQSLIKWVKLLCVETAGKSLQSRESYSKYPHTSSFGDKSMELSTDINLDSTSSLDLRPKDNRFKYELNLGLALPAKFRADKDYDITKEHSSLVKSVNEDGSVAMIKIKTQSNEGPLGGFDNDVLTVLLTMAWEQKEYNQKNKLNQNGYRVYYTHYEICRRLGLKEGSAGYVSESIDKISSQNLTLNNFAYTTIDKKAIRKDEQTKIILKKGRVSLADASQEMDEYTSYFYVEFDNFVVKNLYNDYVSVLNSKKYLSLKTGPTRRVFVFLSSKRKIFGNRFLFDLQELSQVLGIYESTPKKQRELVGKYLTSVGNELNSITFVIEKQRGKNSWSILIQFIEDIELLELESNLDPFYKNLVDYYGEKSLEKLGLQEADIINFRTEFEGKYRAGKGNLDFIFQGEQINPAEFSIDLAMFQVIKKFYPVTKSFKALAKAILSAVLGGVYEIPEGYRFYLTKKLQNMSKKREKIILEEEKQKQVILKTEESRKLDKAFLDFYKNIVQKNKRQMNNYREKAKMLLEMDNVEADNMMYGILLESKVEYLAKEDFNSGNVMDMVQGGGDLLLN
jgi:hypothetical protein